MKNEDILKKVIHSIIFSTAKTAFDSGRNDTEHSFDELDLMIKTMEEDLHSTLKNIIE